MGRKKRRRLAFTRATPEEKASWRAYVVPGMNGDECPRCGRPTEIREHAEITKRHLEQPFYYSRWFCCVNPACRTSVIMPERFKVPPVERLAAPDDIVLTVLDEMKA